MAVDAKNLSYKVDGKAAFEFPLSDVSGSTTAKDDVMIEFHVDDTTGDQREDVLTEAAFYVPPGNQDFPADGERVEG